jgi:hypothetical protein
MFELVMEVGFCLEVRLVRAVEMMIGISYCFLLVFA